MSVKKSMDTFSGSQIHVADWKQNLLVGSFSVIVLLFCPICFEYSIVPVGRYGLSPFSPFSWTEGSTLDVDTVYGIRIPHCWLQAKFYSWILYYTNLSILSNLFGIFDCSCGSIRPFAIFHSSPSWKSQLWMWIPFPGSGFYVVDCKQNLIVGSCTTLVLLFCLIYLEYSIRLFLWVDTTCCHFSFFYFL